LTTRTDHAEDSGGVDMGHHYPAVNPPAPNADGGAGFCDFAIPVGR
jgi:hypothetical protein